MIKKKYRDGTIVNISNGIYDKVSMKIEDINIYYHYGLDNILDVLFNIKEPFKRLEANITITDSKGIKFFTYKVEDLHKTLKFKNWSKTLEILNKEIVKYFKNNE